MGCSFGRVEHADFNEPCACGTYQTDHVNFNLLARCFADHRTREPRFQIAVDGMRSGYGVFRWQPALVGRRCETEQASVDGASPGARQLMIDMPKWAAVNLAIALDARWAQAKGVLDET